MSARRPWKLYCRYTPKGRIWKRAFATEEAARAAIAKYANTLFDVTLRHEP